MAGIERHPPLQDDINLDDSVAQTGGSVGAMPSGMKAQHERLRAMAFANQREWVERIGALDTMAQPRTVFRARELVAALTGTTGAILLPDPAANTDGALLEALAWLRHGGSGDVLIWAEEPDVAFDRWLSAHGARPGFRPLWMCRDLRQPVASSAGSVATIRPAESDDLSLLLQETGIPYTSAWQARSTHHLATISPQNARLLLALRGNRLVGRVMINLTGTASDRTAGIYDLAVHADHQRLGIGSDLTRAALVVAHEAGATVVTLNATPAGERMYRQAGFDEIGHGQTWLLAEQSLRRPPSEDAIRFVTCLASVEIIQPSWHWLSRSILPNGESPLALAARFHQPGSVRQLLALGTVPDIAAVWQVGLHDFARAMMRDPAALHARRDPEGATPLHIAIRWHDHDLLTALLDAGADPHRRDRGFRSDAWGWARAVGDDASLRLLNERFPDDAESG